MEGLSPLRLRFDAVGSGEVWIDDIQLSALRFSREENFALLKLLSPADVKLQNGQVTDCMQLLNSYWPRFLTSNVPLPETPVSQQTVPVARPAEPTEEPPKGFMSRVKQWIPEKLRF